MEEPNKGRLDLRGGQDTEQRSRFDQEAQTENLERPCTSDLLDPMARQLAAQNVKATFQEQRPVHSPNVLPADLERLLTRFVRRAAWGGDRSRAVARLEVGSGELAGATLIVEADRRALSVDLELPIGVPVAPWRERIASRLRERGFELRELHVH